MSYGININSTANITANIDLTATYNEGDLTEIVLTADSGYGFDQTPQLTVEGDFSDTTRDFTTNQTGTITEYSISNPEDGRAFGDLYIENVAVSEISYDFYIQINSTDHLTANIDLTAGYNDGEVTDIILTADEGYYFTQTPTITIQGSLSDVTEDFTTTETDVFITECAFYDVDTYDRAWGDLIIASVNLAELPATEPEFGGYGILNIYQLDAQKLKEIEESDPTASTLKDNILKLNRLFIDITEDVTSDTIKLGSSDTGITADLVTTDNIELNLGSVTVPEKYGNSNDYNNSEIEIFLPFVGFQSLDATDVINKTLTLIYRVNILTGDTSVLIYDETETLIKNYDCIIGYPVPYYYPDWQNENIIGNLSPNNNHLLGFTPYILHRYYEPINSVYKKETGVRQFNNITGFYKFTDINLNQSGLLKREYDEIKRLLNEGVVF